MQSGTDMKENETALAAKDQWLTYSFFDSSKRLLKLYGCIR